MTNTNTTTIIKNGIELNTNFDGYMFGYSTDESSINNIHIPTESIVLLESLIKLGKTEFNKTMHGLVKRNSRVYNILYGMKEISYVNNPYDVIVFHTLDLNTGKINVNDLRKLIEKLDPSTRLMEEDYILNRGLFFSIITIIAKYNGMSVSHDKIRLPRYVANKCLYKMKKDGFKLKVENGYQYVRDILKEVMKNK